MSGTPWVFSYDICDNKRRARMLYQLRKMAAGRQKSVFECQLRPGELAQLYWTLSAMVEEGDSLLFMPVSRQKEVIRLGRGQSFLFRPLVMVL